MSAGCQIGLGDGLVVVVFNNEPLGVEHVVDGKVALAQLPVDQILVACQFGAVVPAHAFVVVGGVGIGGEARAGVENAVVWVRVFLDQQVRLRGGKGGLVVPTRYKFFAAQLVAVKPPLIHQHQSTQSQHHVQGFDLAQQVSPQQSSRQHHKQQGAEGRTAQQGLAVGTEHVQVKSLLAKSGVARAFQRQKRRAKKCQQQAESAGGIQCPQQALLQPLAPLVAVHPRLQAHKTQIRNDQEGHHQRHGGDAEFVVEREVVEHEPVDEFRVFAPGQNGTQKQGRQGPVARGTANHQQAQNEQKEDHRAHVVGSVHQRLFSPVHAGTHQLIGIGLQRLAAVALLAQCTFHKLVRFCVCVGLFGSAAHEVGNEEIQRFADAVGPAHGVVKIQTGRGFLRGTVGLFRG